MAPVAIPKSKPPKSKVFSVTAEQLDQADEETTAKMAELRKGKSRAKSTPEAAKNGHVSAATLLDGVEVVEERDVEYSKIHRSKQNPRTVFDEDLIKEMAPTIETICKLNPLTIREGTNELIDGETRHRAGQIGKAKTLRCKIIRCTDAQAACIRILTSLQRRDLNAIDRAMGIKALQEQHGLSQRQLEDVLKIKQGTMSNLTRLLDLPANWRAKVISGEITPTAARDLCPFAEEPAVLDSVDRHLEIVPKDEWNAALDELLEVAIREHSRPIEERSYYDRSLKQARSRMVNLKPTPEQREALRIRTVKIYRNQVERCFNIELWNTLQHADEQRLAAKAAKKIDAQSSKSAKPIDPRKVAENAAKQKAMIDKRLYRFKIATLQFFLLESLKTFNDAIILKYALLFCAREAYRERDETLRQQLGKGRDARGYDAFDLRALLAGGESATWTMAHELVLDWVSRPFDTWQSAIGPGDIEILATHAGFDLQRDWPKWCHERRMLASAYLDLLNKDQLAEVAVEWKLTFDANQKRVEIISGLAKAAIGKPAPRALVATKAVNLK